MNDVSKKLRSLYNNGLSYLEFVENAEKLTAEKHLHYLEKMKLTKSETILLDGVLSEVKLLVFCETDCNDCRVVLATLENMRRINPLINYKITRRENNVEIMENFHKEARIPMIIKLSNDSSAIIFHELPEKYKQLSVGSIDDERELLRVKFRKGKFKDFILEQLIDGINDRNIGIGDEI
ncbi:thioredoxin family protein [Alkalibacter mobilis]|uniref:thioredoxin family protein n=1 Tax=Alkalibacter mobilis TaxID=2787712 RepID=UPI00189E5AA6|nr:thioredoxin family protein [Alkalibacter mobilis]MBF7097370.1 thioredoxin family protein [Alkalibacter mobilis]